MCGRKRSWPNFKVQSPNIPEETGKTTKTPSQYSRDLNPGPPEYEGVLTTRPQRSVPDVLTAGKMSVLVLRVVRSCGL
jgi:hypothetical protein